MTTLYAFIKTTSPLHISAPGSMRFDPATGKTSFGGTDIGVACTAVQRMPIFTEDGERRAYPVIAANNLSGRLRRHAARLVLDALKDKGQKVSLSTYTTLQCGAATGNPDGEDITYQEYLNYKNHPYLGLFGGGPKMMRRAFRVHNALPVNADTVATQGTLIHPTAREHLQEGRLTEVWGFRRNDDLRDLVGIHQAEQTVTDFVSTFSARQMLIIEEAKKERGSGTTKTTTKTYSAIEFVPPGVLFGLCVEFSAINAAQQGLFFLALDSLAANERLGGQVRNGFGAFVLEDVRLEIDDAEQTGLFNNGRLYRDHPVVSESLAAWGKAKLDLDAQQLEILLSTSKIKKGAA
jgi:CRISPR type IV-associated protein Csf2